MGGRLGVHEPQVGFVDQGRRLERLAGAFVCHLMGRESLQLVVHQRQQFVGGVRVALLNGQQDAGDFTHLGYGTLKRVEHKRFKSQMFHPDDRPPARHEG